MNKLNGLSYSGDNLVPTIDDTTNQNVSNQIEIEIKLIDTEQVI